MRHIFMSYSRADNEMMRRVRDTLTDEGLEVWTDESLTPGTPSWKVAIERAIEDAGCMVVLLSPDAKKSDWVANEIGYAAVQNVAVFPVLVRGDSKDAVPLQLVNTQRVDVRTRFLAEMQKLVDTVREHLSHLDDADDPPMQDIQWLNRQMIYQQFWAALLGRSQGKTALFANIKPKPDYYIYTSAGKPGVSLGYVISVTDWASVDVYINLSKKERSKKLFDLLHAQKDDIEAALGEPLEWMRLDNKRMSRIRRRFDGLTLPDKATWNALQDRMIAAMIRLDAVFRPRLEAIDDMQIESQDDSPNA